LAPIGQHQLDGAATPGRVGGALGNGGTQAAPPAAFLNVLNAQTAQTATANGWSEGN
jgi:hypothetical protein